MFIKSTWMNPAKPFSLRKEEKGKKLKKLLNLRNTMKKINQKIKKAKRITKRKRLSPKRRKRFRIMDKKKSLRLKRSSIIGLSKLAQRKNR